MVLIIFFGISNKTKEKNGGGEKVDSKQNVFSDVEFINSKFPYIKEVKSVSYIYNKETGDREVGLEKIHFEGIINIGNNFSKEIEKECNWEYCDKPSDLLIKVKDADYMYSDDFEDRYISDSFVGTFYFVPDFNQLIFCGEY